MHAIRHRFAISAAVLLLGLLLAAPASAQKPARAKAAKTVKGVKVKKWTANGVRFEHRTHGNSKIGWERHATTKKSGVAKIHGKLWGNKIKGKSLKLGRQWAKDVTATSPNGATRRTMTISNEAGKSPRTTIYMKPEGVIRKITKWTLGNTAMTHSRDYKMDPKHEFRTVGRPYNVRRTGTKVRAAD